MTKLLKRLLFFFVGSLNFAGRRMAVNRINAENKEMLKRIMRTRTSYDHVEQELDYQVGTCRPTPSLHDWSKHKNFAQWPANRISITHINPCAA